MERIPKVLISGYYGFNNFGDEAVLSVLVSSLKKVGITDITVLSADTDNTKRRFEVNAEPSFNLFKVIRAITNSDFLFSGGGNLLQDVTSLKSLIYYLGIIFLALIFGKKVIIFAQGIGPIKNKAALMFLTLLFSRCEYITVRDDKSLFLLRSKGLKPFLVSDPVWNIQLREKYSHHAVGIQLRQWKGLTDDMIYKLAKYIADVYSDKIIFIYALQKSLDYDVCDKLERALKKINHDLHTHLVTNRNDDEIVTSFSHLDELIAMRYHACLLGLKYGCRVLPIVYDEKVEKLADEFSLKNRIYLHNEEEIEASIRNIRYGNYEANLSGISSKYFDFSPFEEIISKDGKN